MLQLLKENHNAVIQMRLLNPVQESGQGGLVLELER